MAPLVLSSSTGASYSRVVECWLDHILPTVLYSKWFLPTSLTMKTMNLVTILLLVATWLQRLTIFHLKA